MGNKHDLTGSEAYAKANHQPQMPIFKMALIFFSVFIVLFSIAGMVEV